MNNISNTSSTSSRYRNLIISSTNNSEYFSRYAEILLDYINLLGDDDTQYSYEPDNNESDNNEPDNLQVNNTTENLLNYIPNLSNLYDKLNTDLNFIYDIMNIKYSKYPDMQYTCKLLNLYRHIIYVICNLFKNCLVGGDLISEIYMIDNFIDPKLNFLNLRKKEIFFIVDSTHSLIDIETLTNSILLLTKCTLTYYYQYHDRYIINLEILNYDHETFYLSIHILSVPKLLDCKYMNISPYLKNEKVKINFSKEKFKKFYFLNKFEHNRLCLVKNNWGNDYVVIENENDEYYVNKIENSKIKDILFNKFLKYSTDIDNSAVEGMNELETFFKYSYLKKKDNIILSRLYNFINTIYILFFLEKGWTFENIKTINFEKNDSCYICSYEYKDYKADDIYKVSINCCRESINGICLNCFVKNVMENYKILKSYYSCPFCKKEHIFYNQKISKLIENLERI